MDRFKLEPTKYTIEVDLDPATGIFSLSGSSYPEDAMSFFEPVNEWIENYIDQEKRGITLNIRMNYINSSSSKCFIDIFEILENYAAEGGEVMVNWYYMEDDDDIYDTGEELLEDMDFPYQLIAY